MALIFRFGISLGVVAIHWFLPTANVAIIWFESLRDDDAASPAFALMMV
jgi:hypothetical protein